MAHRPESWGDCMIRFLPGPRLIRYNLLLILYLRLLNPLCSLITSLFLNGNPVDRNIILLITIHLSIVPSLHP